MADPGRWATEQEFFDAEEYSEDPIPAYVIERYQAGRKPFLPAEHPYFVLGDVRGKRILEVGCGDGSNSVLLALKGATVIGIDLSPKAIGIAQKRAAMHGMQDRTEFFALPIESYLERTDVKFDIICGFAILHHLLPVLDPVMADLMKLSRPGTGFMFFEPVSLMSWLRRFRLALPIKTYGTPDERPLEPRDIAIVQKYLPHSKIRYFGFFLRVWHRFLAQNYEQFSPLRTACYDTLARLDNFLLSLPGFRMLASSAIIYTDPNPR